MSDYFQDSVRRENMEAHKVNVAGQNEVAWERIKEDNVSDFVWGPETSGSKFAQNGDQDPVNPFLLSPQNGATSKQWNPFYSSPEDKVNGLIHSATTVNPFSTQSKDSKTSTVDEENKLPSAKYLSGQQSNGCLWASSVTTHEPLKADFSPILAKNVWAVFPSSVNQEVKSQQMTSPNHMSDILQVTPTSSERLHTTSTKQNADVFQPYNAKEESSISQSMAAIENTEDTKLSNEKDYLLEYTLSNQKNNFQSTAPHTTVSSWQPDVSQDTCFVPPIVTTDLFQTPDSFTDTASVSSDLFQTPLSSVENGILQSTPLFQTPATMPREIKSFDPLSDDSAVKTQESHFNVHATPGTGTLQESPAVTPRPNTLADGGLMFSRHALKPVPRIKVYKSPNQAMYPHTLSTTPIVSPIVVQLPETATPAPVASTLTPPTPVPRSKTNIQMGPTQAVENMQVYEDILFIGQEMCVEDWPEDSPELSPEWKPAGKLKLRRESLRISTAESEGALTNSLGRKSSKLKLGKKLRSSVLSRRGSKNKPGGDLKLSQTDGLSEEPRGGTTDSIYGSPLSWETKLHDSTVDDVFSSDQDEQSTAMDKSKKKKKNKLLVPHLHYRMSKTKMHEGFENGTGHQTPVQISKEDLLEERGSVLQSGGNMWKGKENLQERKDCRPKEPLKMKPSVPPQLPKDTFEDDLTKTKKLQFLDKSKAVYPDEMFTQKGAKNSMLLYNGDKPEEMQDCRPKRPVKLKVARLSWKGSKGTMVKTDSEKNWSLDTLGSSLNEEEGAAGYTPSWKLKHEAFCNDNLTSLDKGEQTKEMDSQSKKPIKMRVPRLPRKGSKSTLDEEFQQKGADLFKARDLKTSEFNMYKDYSELKKPPILRVPLQTYSDSKGLEDAGTPAKGAELFKAGNCDDTWTLTEEYTLDTQPQKLKSQRPSRESKAKDQYFPEDLDPTGATCSDYLSEAAKAEWRSSQMDVRRSRDPEDEQQLEAVEEEEEGDTDSLMEWWNTVELWDEVPSDEEISLKEDETKSFTEIAGKVHRGLRVFYKSFTEQAEVLYQHVLFLYAIVDDLSSFHRRARIANITGGTTTAVGGVAAIAGLALAPVTFGASLIVSAVGLGVATAGGIAAASAAISDNVHDMSDRKKIELLVQDYETRLTDLQRCLHFVAEGIRRLCCHPLLRRNNYYTGDWEVRRALQTVSLVTEPVERAEEIVNSAIVALNNECKGMDKYFTKDSRELKKGCKKELTARVQMLAKQLHDGLVALNSIREQLLDATGNI